MGKDHNIDQLTNKGWDMMRRTLDQELPEKKRSRRAIWWWWTVAAVFAGLMAVGGGQWWYRPGSPNGHAPNAATEAALSTPQVQQTGVQKTSETLTTSEGSAPAAEMPVSTATTPPAAIHTAAHPNTGDRARKNVQHPAPVNAPILAGTAIAGIETDNAETVPTDGQSADTETGTPVQIQNDLAVLMPLENNALTTLDAPQTAPAIPENTRSNTILKPADLHQWHLGLTAGALADGVAPEGFSAGWTISWQPLTRWGLRSGLQYTYQHSNTRSLGLSSFTTYDYYNQAIADAAKSGFALDNMAGTPGVAASNVTPDSLRQEILYAPVNSLSRLELPVSIFFQARPRLRLYAGASVGYLLKATTSASSIANSRFLTRASQGNAALLQSTNLPALQQLVTASLPKIDTRLQLSLGWRPYKWLELNAGWQYAFATQGTGAAKTAESLNGPSSSSVDPQFAKNADAYRVKASTLTLGATFWLY